MNIELLGALAYCYKVSKSYTIIIEENDTEILIERDTEGNPWVAFRGSEHPLDWTYDALALPYTQDDVTYHLGFWALYNRCREELLPHIENDKKIYIVGHSLGAALTACMVSSERELEGKEVKAYGFGMPKPGYNLKNGHKLTTILNPFDPITYLPRKKEFKHPGQVIYLPKKIYEWNTHSLDTYNQGLRNAKVLYYRQ